MNPTIATDIEFAAQLDGTIRVTFQDNEGDPINIQVITPELLVKIPLVAFVTLMGMELGPEVAKKLVQIMRAAEEEAEDGNQ